MPIKNFVYSFYMYPVSYNFIRLENKQRIILNIQGGFGSTFRICYSNYTTNN